MFEVLACIVALPFTDPSDIHKLAVMNVYENGISTFNLFFSI